MHSCGFPKHVCMHPENDGYFEMPEVRTVCHADAAVENRRKDKNWEAEPGEVLTVVYTRPADEPLPPMPGPREITK